MTTFINRGIPTAASGYYRPASYVPVPPRPVADVRDDYERWYTETVFNNRMSLSLRSGIHSEIGWALERLLRLAMNDQFLLSSIPGLTDGLFDWPEWYVTEGHESANDEQTIFSPPPAFIHQHRYALESLYILRNTAINDQNARELANHSHTFPLIINGLYNLDFTRDENQEALFNIIDIFLVLAPNFVVNTSTTKGFNPILPLTRIAAQASNRRLIMASLNALNAVLSHPSNSPHLPTASLSLNAAVRYLPLFVDQQLYEVCLEHIYVHVSHPAMARAFLLRTDMPSVLKVLATLILSEQQTLEEKVTIDITGAVHTVPSTSLVTRSHELTKEELDGLLEKPEPQRCYDWMRTMFVAKTDGELTQVDFWNLYKDAFTPFQDDYPLLVASDVIKNVNSVFPQAQAMVLQGPVQRFVVRGVDRRKDLAANERFKCQWDRSRCSILAFSSASDLFEHLLDHLANVQSDFACLWSTCSQNRQSIHSLRSHLLTHLSGSQSLPKHPSQSDTITLPSGDSPYPTNTPTSRPPPPPRSTIITYERPTVDPPSTSLTALLIIRILFRSAFASAEVAPKVDADHFGFPGVVEDTTDPNAPDIVGGFEGDSDKDGERRGRKAFIGIRRLLEGIQIRDDVLMSWVTEMVDAVVPGTN